MPILLTPLSTKSGLLMLSIIAASSASLSKRSSLLSLGLSSKSVLLPQKLTSAPEP
ncbi:MAG: hypothetical protein L7G91_04760 [Acidilobus sp.]|nr:hypothetical protein [Acidilobus sp.]